jgi:hypothetical protein
MADVFCRDFPDIERPEIEHCIGFSHDLRSSCFSTAAPAKAFACSDMEVVQIRAGHRDEGR